MPAASRRRRRSARILVGILSGDLRRSPYVVLPQKRFRTTNSDHLSPMRSSERKPTIPRLKNTRSSLEEPAPQIHCLQESSFRPLLASGVPKTPVHFERRKT